MTAERVTKRQIVEELRDLEPGRWLEVLDFIGYLKHLATSEHERARPRKMTARDLLQSDLTGMWADREDIGDSLTFARQLRQQAEYRWRATNDIG
jgi:hypothetical protein